jgi:hypothetical protein
MFSIVALLLAWPALADASSAQAPAADPVRDERAQAAEERRILSLNDGRKLRALARSREGAWEVRDGNVWLVLPEGLVRGVESEREVLARMRELSARVKPDDLAGKCALADWMVQQGLLAEALAALDQILLADPEHASARALIARGAIQVALPRASAEAAGSTREDIDALLRFGAQSRPAVRELVAARLAEQGQPELLREELLRALKSGVVTRRSFALLALRRVLPGSGLRELLACAAFDPSEDVRAAAALGLRQCESAARVVPLVRLLAGDDAATRMHAVEALGAIGDLAALQPLLVHLERLTSPSSASGSGSGGLAPRSHIFVGNHVAYLRDFDVQIAQGASIADPIPDVVTEATQLDVRVTGIGVESITPAAEKRALCRALARLSGEKTSDDPERWFAWWKQRAEAAQRASAGTPPR